MDASERVVPNTIESLREEILHTRESIVENIDRLGDAVQSEVSSFTAPFQIRERVQRHPFLACGLAVACGVLVAQTRTRQIPLRLAVGVGRGIKVVTRDVLTSRALEALRGVFSSPDH
jgi:hypothetical protein